ISLPQTECAAPPGEHAVVNVCPSLPFSDVAFASQVVGVPSPAEDGEAGPVFELSWEVLVWPPPPGSALLFSFLSVEQAALSSTIAVSKSTMQTQMIRRSSRMSDSGANWYDGVT